jgi:hypothetical protein
LYWKKENFNVLKIIGEEGKYYLLECDVCSRDAELFPEIRQLKDSFKRSKIPCGCSKKAKYTSEQWEILLTRELKNRSEEYSLISYEKPLKSKAKINLYDKIHNTTRTVKLQDFMNKKGVGSLKAGGFKTSKSKRTDVPTIEKRVNSILSTTEGKTLISLLHEKQWFVIYNCSKCAGLSNKGNFRIPLWALENKGFNCKCHSNSFVRNEDDAKKEVCSIIEPTGGTFMRVVGGYSGFYASKVEWFCGKGHQNIQLMDTLLHKGARCSKCAKYGFNKGKDAFLYVVEFTERGSVYLKYGITNREKTDQRLRQIFKGKPYCKVLILYGSGDYRHQIEKEIKVKLKHSSSEFTINSGKTEVLHCSELSSLINIILKYTEIEG